MSGGPLELVGAVTFQQPWATAIIDGVKPVENRGWRFPFPTPAAIAVHAGLEVAAAATVAAFWPDDVPQLPARALPRGVYLGTVTVTSCHQAGPCSGRCSDWSSPDGHHWMLADPRALPLPMPALGALRVWQPHPVHRTVLQTVCCKENP